MTLKNLWITGYRGFELNIFDDQDPRVLVIKRAIADQIKLAILEENLEWVISGGQLGIEQWAIEQAVLLRQEFPELKVALMRPFLDFGGKWSDNNQQRLANLISQVDFSESVGLLPYQSPAQLKSYQKFMLTHTEGALMIYDEEHPGKSQYDLTAARQQANYPIQLIGFDDLGELARTLEEEQRDNEPIDY